MKELRNRRHYEMSEIKRRKPRDAKALKQMPRVSNQKPGLF